MKAIELLGNMLNALVGTFSSVSAFNLAAYISQCKWLCNVFVLTVRKEMASLSTKLLSSHFKSTQENS